MCINGSNDQTFLIRQVSMNASHGHAELMIWEWKTTKPRAKKANERAYIAMLSFVVASPGVLLTLAKTVLNPPAPGAEAKWAAMLFRGARTVRSRACLTSMLVMQHSHQCSPRQKLRKVDWGFKDCLHKLRWA
jgi:hypothetical protein